MGLVSRLKACEAALVGSVPEGIGGKSRAGIQGIRSALRLGEMGERGHRPSDCRSGARWRGGPSHDTALTSGGAGGGGGRFGGPVMQLGSSRLGSLGLILECNFRKSLQYVF
jgi:hypothetical protein